MADTASSDDQILPRLMSLTLGDEYPGRALATLVTRQQKIRLPVDELSAVAAVNNDDVAVRVAISPPPGSALEMRQLVVVDAQPRKSYVITYSLPLVCRFHAHAVFETRDMRLTFIVDVSNAAPFPIAGDTLHVVTGGTDQTTTDFAFPPSSVSQIVVKESSTSYSSVWLLDAETEIVTRMIQFDLPRGYCCSGGSLELASAGSAAKLPKIAIVGEDVAWVPWPCAPDFEHAVSRDATSGKILVQVRSQDAGEDERGRKKTKNSKPVLDLWVMLPLGFGTPTATPEYRAAKTLATGRKMLEFTVETAEEAQISIEKWTHDPSV